MRDRHDDRTTGTRQGGSMLVEVLAALAMGVVVAASVHGFHTAAVDAMERAMDRRVATWTAVADVELRSVSSVRLEHLTAGSEGWTVPSGDPAVTPDEGPGSDDVSRLVGASAPGRVVTLRRDAGDRGNAGSRVCPTHAGAHVSDRLATEVQVEPRDPVDRGNAERPPTTVTLEGGIAAERRSDTRRIERRVIDALGVPVVGVELRAVGPVPATTVRSAVTGSSGCVSLDDLAPGDYLVSLVADGYVDSAHVALDVRPPTLVGLGSGDDVAFERLASASVVRVEVGVPSGALLPDLLSVPSLRWSVIDDDRRLAMLPGESRTLQPGHRTLVLGVCGAAAAGGSRQRLELQSGTTDVVEVQLAVVRLVGTTGYVGSTIHVQRSAPCFDGTALRPWLRWTSVVREGVELALPADTWTLEVRAADGRRQIGPIGVQTGTAPVVLRLGA